MFRKLHDLFLRAVGVRLTVWYSALFIVSLVGLFLTVYFMLSSLLQKKDFEIIHTRLNEMVEEYKEGIPEVQKVSDKRFNGFLVRVADRNNSTLFATVPDEDELAGPEIVAQLEKQKPAEGRWLSISVLHHGTFEIANKQMRDGSYVQVGRTSRHRQIFLNRFRKVSALVIFPMFLLAIGGGAFVSRRALAPIHQLNKAVHDIITTGKMDARISPRHTDGELRELVVSFNQMMDRIEALIFGMRGVLDNVAHDLRTPLTRLRGIAEMALQNPCDSNTAQEALADCIEESERVTTMLNTLMDISEVETGAMHLNLTNVHIATIVEQIVDLYRDVADEKSLQLSTAIGGDWIVSADENRLRQAVGNLLDNAVKYTPEGGKVCIEVNRADGFVTIGVRDSGIGIPTEEIPHVWERLYRGDKSRSQRGLGLGLSLVKAIAQAHSGVCEVESAPGAGSLFQLRLPATT